MQITLNGKRVDVSGDKTILDVAVDEGVKIPTLCHDPDLAPHGSCRICLCEVNGKLVTSCNTPVQDGAVVYTDSDRVIEARKIILKLLIARHGSRGWKRDELMDLAKEYKIDMQDPKYIPHPPKKPYDNISKAIYRDPSLCILCGKCVNKCRDTQTVDAICLVGRNKNQEMGTPFDYNLDCTSCVDCGQCTLVCPTGAIREVDDTDKVLQLLENRGDKLLVAQTAPSVRVTIGEEFGFPPGTNVKKKLVAGLRKMGFDRVFDTDFGADLTINEEAAEFAYRLTNNKVLPMTTSCCPGYVKFVERFYPDLICHLSSCRSPQQMFGAIVKSYYAEKFNIDPHKIVVVSIMPCTAKKFECQREELQSPGGFDVDMSLTTRETARMLKDKGIDLQTIEDEEYDQPLGESTGAGVIFGATGGVMEAALRTAYEYVTKKELKRLDFNDVRGLGSIKETSIDIGGKQINVAVAHGLGNARILLEEIKAGRSKYHFIEVMACLGGCLGGGGQPIPTNDNIRTQRMKSIYTEDKDLPIRKSHENPSIKELYAKYLKEPLSETSHHLLHTHYTRREKL